MFVAMTHSPLILPRIDALDDLVVGPAGLGRESLDGNVRASARPSRDAAALVKSCPPSRLVVLLNRREPIALHWPVIEFAPVPGRPMLPVISARLMIACAVRVRFVALVHAHRPPERHALCRAGWFPRTSAVRSTSQPGFRRRLVLA